MTPHRHFKGFLFFLFTHFFSSFFSIDMIHFSLCKEQCQLTIKHSCRPGSQMHSNQSWLMNPGWLSQPLTVTDWSVLRQPDIDMETTLMSSDLWDPAREGVWQSCQVFSFFSLGSSAEIKIKERQSKSTLGQHKGHNHIPHVCKWKWIKKSLIKLLI